MICFSFKYFIHLVTEENNISTKKLLYFDETVDTENLQLCKHPKCIRFQRQITKNNRKLSLKLSTYCDQLQGRNQN